MFRNGTLILSQRIVPQLPKTAQKVVHWHLSISKGIIVFRGRRMCNISPIYTEQPQKLTKQFAR
jgi:hypothetical protein